jgi:hypothetical protein
MTESYIQLPNDSANTGKKVRSNERTVSGSSVHEHFMILQDYDSDTHACIVASSVVGSESALVTRNIPQGTQVISGSVNSSIVNPSTFVTNFPASQAVTISGTLNSSILNPSTYITNASIPVTGTFYQSTQPVSLASTVNTSILNPSTFVTNFPASQAVTGTFWQTTQPVSFSGTVQSSILNPSTYVTNFPATQAVTFSGTVSSSILNPSTYITNSSLPVTFSSTVNSSILNPSTYFYPSVQAVSGSVTASVINTSSTPIFIDAPVVQDTGNSTTTPLGSNATFTGTAFYMNDFASWSVTIFADQASAANGLKIQWSNDGSNWDFVDQTTYAASVGNMITFGRKAHYVRLVYTNGASAQGTFRVSAFAQPFAVRQTRKFIGSALTDQDTGQVVMAALQGHTTVGGGSWVDVKVNPSGALSADVTGTVAVTQSTSPWVVSGTINSSTLNPSSYITNASIPVTGTFWQTTQPISGTVTANLGTGSTVAISGLVNTSSFITNTSIPVTGTFYQATQPVSLAATVNTSVLNASTYITNTSMPTTPVTGTFWQSTQPVSIAATLNTSVLNPSSYVTNASIPVTQSGTWNIATLNTVTSMNGQPIAMGTGTRSAGTQRVTIATDDVVPASQSGTWNIGTLTTATTVSSLTGGGTLVDAAVNLNPINIGGRAAQANPTAVSASGDLVNIMTDDVGRLVTSNTHVRDLVVQNRLVLASATETSILAAGGSGVFQDLTAITVSNTSTSTPVNVDIRDATTGTVRLTLTCPGSATTGAVFQTPFTQTTANNPWTIQCSGAVSSIITTIQAVKNV